MREHDHDEGILEEFDVVPSEASLLVSVLGNIKGMKAWVFFIEEDDQSGSGSAPRARSSIRWRRNTMEAVIRWQQGRPFIRGNKRTMSWRTFGTYAGNHDKKGRFFVKCPFLFFVFEGQGKVGGGVKVDFLHFESERLVVQLDGFVLDDLFDEFFIIMGCLQILI